jgi:hypothetical protein
MSSHATTTHVPEGPMLMQEKINAPGTLLKLYVAKISKRCSPSCVLNSSHANRVGGTDPECRRGAHDLGVGRVAWVEG